MKGGKPRSQQGGEVNFLGMYGSLGQEKNLNDRYRLEDMFMYQFKQKQMLEGQVRFSVGVVWLKPWHE